MKYEKASPFFSVLTNYTDPGSVGDKRYKQDSANFTTLADHLCYEYVPHHPPF